MRARSADASKSATQRASASDGLCKYYHHDGKTLKAVGRLVGGKFEGLWKWYASNGALRQVGRFEKGLQVGLWKRYYGGTNQLVDVGKYANGKRIGKWKFYARDGRLLRITPFGRRK